MLKETVDVTLPVREENIGRIHPVSKIYEEVVAIFGEMGFEIADGPVASILRTVWKLKSAERRNYVLQGFLYAET